MKTARVSARDRDCPGSVESLIIRKHLSLRIANYPVPEEHIHEVQPRIELLTYLLKENVDIFTFIQRSFLGSQNRYLFPHDLEPIGLLVIDSFDEWWRSIRYNARRYIKKAIKMGVETRPIQVDDNFITSAARIYNETPIRQGRRYSGYGLSLADLRKKFAGIGNSQILGAYFKNELIGILWVRFGDRVAAFESFVSLIKHRDKFPNNALVAESVKICSLKGFRFLTYGNMGYLPSLDFFKSSHGFRVFYVPRYYIPLSTKGNLGIRLGLQKLPEHSVPRQIQRGLLPIYNFFNKRIPDFKRAANY